MPVKKVEVGHHKIHLTIECSMHWCHRIFFATVKKLPERVTCDMCGRNYWIKPYAWCASWPEEKDFGTFKGRKK